MTQQNDQLEWHTQKKLKKAGPTNERESDNGSHFWRLEMMNQLVHKESKEQQTDSRDPRGIHRN
jgi:hypothetical protein